MKHTKNYIKDYPRPQFVRSDWKLLDGQWDFKFDDLNMGEQNGFYKGFTTETKINVPFSYQTKLSGIEQIERHDYLWYQRSLEIDLEKLKTKKYIFNFEGSDYITKVWVDGIYIGSHEGGYTRFSFDLTHILLQDLRSQELL